MGSSTRQQHFTLSAPPFLLLHLLHWYSLYGRSTDEALLRFVWILSFSAHASVLGKPLYRESTTLLTWTDWFCFHRTSGSFVVLKSRRTTQRSSPSNAPWTPTTRWLLLPTNTKQVVELRWRCKCGKNEHFWQGFKWDDFKLKWSLCKEIMVSN